MILFWMENIHTGAKEQITEAQWDTLKKMFPNQFRKISTPANYSEEARSIIDQAEGKEAVDTDAATEE